MDVGAEVLKKHGCRFFFTEVINAGINFGLLRIYSKIFGCESVKQTAFGQFLRRGSCEELSERGLLDHLESRQLDGTRRRCSRSMGVGLFSQKIFHRNKSGQEDLSCRRSSQQQRHSQTQLLTGTLWLL